MKIKSIRIADIFFTFIFYLEDKFSKTFCFKKKIPLPLCKFYGRKCCILKYKILVLSRLHLHTSRQIQILNVKNKRKLLLFITSCHITIGNEFQYFTPTK